MILVVLGCAAIVRGAALVWSFAGRDQASIVVWLAAGLLLHDLVFAPLCVFVIWAARRVIPADLRTPVLIALAYTNLLLLLALPVIWPRPAADRPDNPTVLDRPFGWGLTVAVVAVWAVTALVIVTRRRRRGRAQV
ncbi:hypothetical protein AAFP35_22055 [Gordonia sp. CPCC 206044]|uniref:hypothetical protein n=1 Tax=Gordonia sp. CPCC 206044 TaxID=3140793 RepID=UPI003AF3C0E2